MTGMGWLGRWWGGLWGSRRRGMALLARQQAAAQRRYEFTDRLPEEPRDSDVVLAKPDRVSVSNPDHALREYLAAELRSDSRPKGPSARDVAMGRLLREMEVEQDRGAPTSDDEHFERAVAAAMAQGRVQIPMMPRVAVQLQRAAADPRASVRQLASIIESDPSVAAEVLRVANSPFYRSLVESKSVRAAMSKMGLSGTRDVVMMATFRGRVLKAHPALQQEARALWEHAVGSGYLARLLATELRLDPDVAFTAGLFHDVGKLVLLDVAASLAREQRRDMTPSRQALARSFHAHHVEASVRVAERWSLTADVIAIINDHHRPPAGQPHEGYIRLLTAADAMVTDGLSSGFGDLVAMRRAVKFAGVALTDEQVTRLALGFFEDFEETRALLG
ncbi:MAG: hypothetical protein AMXMBFR64_21220 [Myxococcales bacterium]